MTEPCAGYTTPPKVTIKGFEKSEFVVAQRFDKALRQNGSVQSSEVKKSLLRAGLVPAR